MFCSNEPKYLSLKNLSLVVPQEPRKLLKFHTFFHFFKLSPKGLIFYTNYPLLNKNLVNSCNESGTVIDCRNNEQRHAQSLLWCVICFRGRKKSIKLQKILKWITIVLNTKSWQSMWYGKNTLNRFAAFNVHLSSLFTQSSEIFSWLSQCPNMYFIWSKFLLKFRMPP
jgi:hypothetical protein